MEKILVTGGSGFIGTNLIEYLLKNGGYEVENIDFKKPKINERTPFWKDVEGLANTILESMSVGLPMVLSNIPSHQEVLNHMNDTVGCIMNQHNIDDVKQKINTVLKLDPENTREVLYSTYLKYYTAEGMSKKYQKAYKNIVAKIQNV